MRFYQNDYHPGGNSYYREVGGSRPDFYFPQHRFINATTRSLDSVVRERGWPLPDLIKVDVQVRQTWRQRRWHGRDVGGVLAPS